ncbi:hypothetical protein [Methylomicrobium lacus]|uniref:hypothetical protein n=1 Tax=Methylomicrobium lacus TaxID=136992 RepID=UPI00045EB492|nr:hypothetical protein [Methylomicrobium lacus]
MATLEIDGKNEEAPAGLKVTEAILAVVYKTGKKHCADFTENIGIVFDEIRAEIPCILSRRMFSGSYF